MASCTVSNISYTSATVNASANSAASNTRKWTVYLNNSVYETFSNKAQSVSRSLSGLTPGTYYTVKVRYGSTGTEYLAGSTSFTTLSRPSYTLSLSVSCTDTSITATASIYSAISIDLDLTLYLDGARGLAIDIPAGSTSNTRTYTSNIIPNTSYTLKLTDNDTGKSISESITTSTSFTFSVESTYDTVGLVVNLKYAKSYDRTFTFYLDDRSFTKTVSANSTSVTGTFTSNISPATVYKCKVQNTTDSETKGPINGRSKNNFSWTGGKKVAGSKFVLLATDWNKFTSQLKAKEQYFTTTDNRTFTTVEKGNTITAAIFNQAINAINNIATTSGGTTTMSTVAKGGIIYASTCNQLVDCLNE